MSWFIDSEINEGYPALNGWAESWQTGWTSNSTVRYPDGVWRIDGTTNDGYPWLWWWFKTSQTDTGDMVIGGSQTNYPNGLSTANRGGLEDNMNDNSMISTWNFGGDRANRTIVKAIEGRAYAIADNDLVSILSSLNNGDVFDTAAIEIISQFYGANIFDAFLICKVFPFDLTHLQWANSGGVYSVVSSTTSQIKAFGRFGLEYENVPITARQLASTVGYYQFPTIEVTPKQAWEIESVDFTLYLPMSGVYPIDIRSECSIDIMLYVDVIDGTGEYYVHIDGQLVGIYRALFGIDVPINTNQGRTQANMLTNVISSFGQAAGKIVGLTVGGAVGGMAGQAMAAGSGLNPLMGKAFGTSMGQSTGEQIGSAAGDIASGIFSQHYTTSSPAVGGLSSLMGYPAPRIIAKIPKMFKDGYGYEQILGANRSTAYLRLNECSGFTKCINYKCDIIVATDEEKQEIERLMNSGVML